MWLLLKGHRVVILGLEDVYAECQHANKGVEDVAADLDERKMIYCRKCKHWICDCNVKRVKEHGITFIVL
jgi:hypothetical protein